MWNQPGRTRTIHIRSPLSGRSPQFPRLALCLFEYTLAIVVVKNLPDGNILLTKTKRHVSALSVESFWSRSPMILVSYGLLACVIVASAVTALRARNLIRAAVALGVGSAALAMVFFMLDAPYAGGFELSVGAGLISVLFIVAISLTRSMGANTDET